MAAVNFILAIYQQLWALVERHAPTRGKLKDGNEVREDQGRLNPRGTRAKAPADFPRIILRHTGIADTGFTQDPTFASLESDIVTSGQGWQEQATVTYDAKIIHDDLRMDVGASFELELLTALRKGGPRLGIDCIVGWTTNSKTVETDADLDAPGRMRRVTTITITVTCLFEGSELIT